MSKAEVKKNAKLEFKSMAINSDVVVINKYDFDTFINQIIDDAFAAGVEAGVTKAGKPKIKMTKSKPAVKPANWEF